MDNATKVQSLGEGITFIGTTDKKRKTNRITAAMLLPLMKETVSCNSIVPFILKRACKLYPDFTSLNEKLALLYGATLSANVRKIGENQLLTLTISALDDRFALDNEEISAQCAALLCSLLFEPPLENSLIRESDLETEKRLLKERIDSEFNDKRTYSKNRALEIMCANEPFGVNVLGTTADVDAIDTQKVTDAWHEILNTAKFVLMVTGPAAPDSVIEGFKSEFSKLDRNFKELAPTQVIKTAQDVKEHTERIDVQQAKLVLGFRAGVAEPDYLVNAMRLMTALFGGTPHSRLFVNVREKLSLCYYCAARYDRQKGIITVESGLEEKNAELAKQEILNQLNVIKNGNFEDSELDAAKMSLANAALSSKDSLAELEFWYLNQVLDSQMYSPEECAQQINAVTREDVILAAENVVLDTVYLLTGSEAE